MMPLVSGISKSTVSTPRVRHGSRTDGDPWLSIGGRVGEFLNRPLTGAWPHLWLDATYLKVRDGADLVAIPSEHRADEDRVDRRLRVYCPRTDGGQFPLS